jgi:hypothetical protein
VFSFEEIFVLYTLWEIFNLKLMANLTSTWKNIEAFIPN